MIGLAALTPAPPSVRGDAPGPPRRAAGTVRATRRRPDIISGFTGPEVVFYALAWPNEPIDEASRAIRRSYRPKYGKNHRPGGANGQTGSRNMAATTFFDSATPTSCSTVNTLWGLSCTLTELSRSCHNYAIVIAARLGENILSLEGAIANFQRTLRRLACVATGLGHVAGQREPFGRRYGGQKPCFRFYRTGSSITRTDFGAWTYRRSITGDRAAARTEIRRKQSTRGRWRPNRK